MSELKFKMGTKSSAVPTTGNSGEVFFATDENKYGHIYFIDAKKKVINIVPELLEVKFGGTGNATHTENSVLVGNKANNIKNIISNSGALYATGLNDEPQFGTLPVEQGGTGNTSQTANRLIYASTADVLSSSGHYASASKIGINSTSVPIGAFHVNGISTFENGHLYLTGADENSSTGNTTQLIFGTKDNNHLAISSNNNTLVLNPNSNSTTNQIVLYLDSQSLFPSGLNATANSIFGNGVDIGDYLNVGTDLSVNANLTVGEDATINGVGIINNGLVVTGRVYGSGDDEGIVIKPASNGYAGLALGSNTGVRSVMYLMPDTNTHRAVWRYNDGTNNYTITHPETNGEIVVHEADKAQGSSLLPVYVASNGVITACDAEDIFSDFSSTAATDGETLSITISGETKTIKLDAASTSQGGIITTGTQTIAGNKTLNGTTYASSILPRTDMSSSYTLGSTSYTWYSTYTRNLTLYDGTNGYTGGYIYTTVGNSTSATNSIAELGNSTATGTAGNRYGILRLYSEGSTYLNLVAHRYAANGTSAATNRTIYLRDHGATAYLAATTTKDQVGSGVIPTYVSTSGVIIASTSTVGSAAIPVYMSSGTITKCTPSSLFSDFSSTAGASGETLSITIAEQNRTITLDAASTSQGGVVTTGAQTFAGNKTFVDNIDIYWGSQIRQDNQGDTYIKGRDTALIRNHTSVLAYAWSPILSSKTYLGSWEAGVCHATSSSANGSGERFQFRYSLDTNYNAGTNTTAYALQLIPNGVALSPCLATTNHGTGTPGTSTLGAGITGAIYFKRV